MLRARGEGDERSVVLCAEDFGLTDGVSHGIIDLVGMERISAVAVMANGPAWPRTGPELLRARGASGIDFGIGLHLTFTLGEPLGPLPRIAPAGMFPSFSALAGRSLAGLPVAEVATEIARQVDRFCDVAGVAPDFVSGYENVHLLPGFRQALFLVLARAGLAGEVWLRDPSDRLRAILGRGRGRGGALAARALSAGFARQARMRGFATNRGFSGFSAHDPDYPPEREFQRFFRHLGPAPVIACRPGYVDDALERMGGIVATRSRDLMYLSSTRFTDLLDVLGVRLVPAPPGAAQPTTGTSRSIVSSPGPTRQA